MAAPIVSIASSGDLYEPSFVIDSVCREVGPSFPEFKIQYVPNKNLPKNMEKPLSLVDRINQLDALHCPTLSFEEVWNVAESFEKTLEFVKPWENLVFFKKKRNVQNIFSFVFDIHHQCFLVFLKKKSPFLEEESLFLWKGTFKKVRAVIVVPFEKKGGVVFSAHKLNKLIKNNGVVDVEGSERRCDSFCREKKVESKYECCPKLFFAMTYFHDVYPNSLKIRRYCVVEELYNPMSFFQLDSHGERPWFLLVKNLMEGLLELYKDGRFHGDVKTSNALWGRDFSAKWTDFGFSARFNEDGSSRECGLNKFYGSMVCTAPEVIGEVVYGRENILAAEAWAFGFMLFSLLKETPPWSDNLYSLLCGEEKDPLPSKNDILSAMEKYLGAMNTVVEQEEPSFFRELKKISLGLLCIDKNARYTVEKALGRLMEAAITFLSQ